MLKDHIQHFGFCASKEEYYSVLASTDVCVSTALHEFFGVSVIEAAALGNLASAVTIQKLGQTGTASAEEIIKQFGGKNNAQG